MVPSMDSPHRSVRFLVFIRGNEVRFRVRLTGEGREPRVIYLNPMRGLDSKKRSV